MKQSKAVTKQVRSITMLKTLMENSLESGHFRAVGRLSPVSVDASRVAVHVAILLVIVDPLAVDVVHFEQRVHLVPRVGVRTRQRARVVQAGGITNDTARVSATGTWRT